MSCKICSDFEKAITLLKETQGKCNRKAILKRVRCACKYLKRTYRPLLDYYYKGKMSKEDYCNVRDYRDTALTYLHYSRATLPEPHLDAKGLDDVHDYNHEALCWTEKANLLFCGGDKCDDLDDDVVKILAECGIEDTCEEEEQCDETECGDDDCGDDCGDDYDDCYNC